MLKRWVLLALTLVFILVVVGCSTTPQYNIVGDWTVYYTWSGETQGNVPLTFSTDHSFEDWVVGSGVWVQGGNNVSWTYDVGGDAVYTGTMTAADAMSGTMQTPTGVPSTGTWYAVRADILAMSRDAAKIPTGTLLPSGAAQPTAK